MPKVRTLADILVEEMRDLYDAEKQLLEALPILAKQAGDENLRKALQSHFQETQHHVARLEEAFARLGQPATDRYSEGVAGLIARGSAAIGREADAAVIDAQIIASAQSLEHYEIAAYGTVVAWAEALDLRDVAHPLRQNLNEEKAADGTLTALAEHGINSGAIGRRRSGTENEPMPLTTAERELSA